MNLSNATILVTGGTAGIGLQLAVQAASAGAQVIVVGREAGRGESAVRQIGPRAQFVQADLTRADEQARLVEHATARWPQLNVLINNAGVQVNMPDVGVGDAGLQEAFRQEIALNFAAPVALSFGLMPLLAKQSEAAIVNISSGLGRAIHHFPCALAPACGGMREAGRSQ